jgi:hypothetical protein
MIRLSYVVLVSAFLLGACSQSKMFDNNCSGNGFFKNPGYCSGDFNAYAGPWSKR